MTPERARWLLDNPFPNPLVTATATEIREASEPYASREHGWRVITCVDL